MRLLFPALGVAFFSAAAYADTYTCDLSPNGKAPYLYDRVEIWLDPNTWSGQIRDAATRSVTANPVSAEVHALSPKKWELKGALEKILLKENTTTSYRFRYRLNTKASTVSLGAKFHEPAGFIMAETGASGACRKTG